MERKSRVGIIRHGRINPASRPKADHHAGIELDNNTKQKHPILQRRASGVCLATACDCLRHDCYADTRRGAERSGHSMQADATVEDFWNNKSSGAQGEERRGVGISWDEGVSSTVMTPLPPVSQRAVHAICPINIHHPNEGRPSKVVLLLSRYSKRNKTQSCVGEHLRTHLEFSAGEDMNGAASETLYNFIKKAELSDAWTTQCTGMVHMGLVMDHGAVHNGMTR